MALPIKPNNPEIPIPNNPFSAPLNPYLQGPYFPFVAGPGVDLSTPGIPTITNDVAAVLSAGSGISLNTVGNITTIAATGGGGSGTVTSVTAGTGLTGGTITTIGTINLANTAVTAGAYTAANITVDAQGRITAAANGSGGGSGTVTSIIAGTGLSGGTITTSGTVALANTAVTAGAYTYGSFTVDDQGRLTAASSGTAPVTSVTGVAPITVIQVDQFLQIGHADTVVTPGAYTYASLTVDAQGHLTAAGNGATPVIVNDFNAKGDLLVGTADNAFTALGVGADTSVLTADAACASGVKWAAGGGSSIPCSCITAKGDLITGTAASTPTTLTVGTDGQALLACSTATNGICWGSVTPSDATPTLRGILYGCSGTTTTGVGCNILTSLTTGLCNTAVGCSVLSSIENGNSNTAVGYNAGSSVIGSGSCNVAMGSMALGNATGTGFILRNTAIGACSLSALTEGSCNVAVGACSMLSQTSGNNNVAVGTAALLNSTTGSNNVAIGLGSLLQNSAAQFNIGVGYASMQGNTTGNCNIAVGVCAHDNLEGGCNNVALGFRAGQNLSTGCYNVSIGDSVCLASANGCCQLAIGFSGTDNWLTGDSTKAIKPGAGIIDCAASTGTAGQVLMSNGSNAICWGAAGGASAATPTVAGIIKGCTTATNSALGCNALLITTGASNSAFGNNALCANTSGIYNTAIGESALYFNTTGSYNTAVGPFALGRTSTGINNTATGHYAMRCNQAGNDNTAAGYLSLRCNVNGCFNTAIGSLALRRNTAGDSNTAIGNRALYLSTGGIGNTAIGSYALCNSTTGCGNVMVGGTNSAGSYVPVFDPTTENDRVMIGSTATTNAYVQVAWSVTSDARDKTNVTALPVGLNFVNQLNPVSFQFKESRECDTATGPVRYGFLAQEVLAAEGENPVIVDTEVSEKLKITNDHFNAVLVKAIQELSAKVEALEAKLEANG